MIRLIKKIGKVLYQAHAIALTPTGMIPLINEDAIKNNEEI